VTANSAVTLRGLVVDRRRDLTACRARWVEAVRTLLRYGRVRSAPRTVAPSRWVAEDGVHVLRDGLPEVFVPRGDLRAVSVEQSLAGKIVSTGMLVLTWRLGGRELATAFRADDPAAHHRLRDALQEAAA